MSRALMISAHAPYPVSQDRLNATLVGRTATLLKNRKNASENPA